MLMTQLPQGLNPLTDEQAQQFAQLVGSMSPVQQAWVSGYLAAAANTTALPVGALPVGTPQVTQEAGSLTVLYGSQTGNAKHLASDVAEAARAKGLDVKLMNMADFKPNAFKSETHMILVTSTQGEGEPPESALKLFDFLGSKKAPKLDGLKAAVLGLGDTSYEFFNKAATDFEDRLTALGASVLVERALLDVDYATPANEWISRAVDAFAPELEAKAPAANLAANNVIPLASVAPKYSKTNPFKAEVLTVQKITGRDSTKDVRHVEISLEGSGLTYRPGDALGVYVQNDPDAVDDILALLSLDGTTEIRLGDATKPLRDALIGALELTQSYPGFVAAYAAATGSGGLGKLAGDKAALRDYLSERQIYDVIREYPAQIAPQALADALRTMQPRLYSIASSQAEAEDEVHVTIALVEYQAFGTEHLGAASGHVARRLEEGDTISVFVEQNDAFRLPTDAQTPVIMIGPGTGIAPFRAFLQDREAQEAGGEAWLFFGDRTFTQDFLYQAEIGSFRKSGALTRLDVAFSRDQAKKIYVQDRLREKGGDLFAWIERGAHVYVCGDATQMARDVQTALLDVVAEHGGLSADDAQEYLAGLRDAGRYQRDVY